MTIDPRLHRIVAAQPYRLLFATISGAHLYGFPSPDSDFDLRGAHVLPLEKVVGLKVRDETVEQSMIVPPDTDAQGGASVLASRLVGSLAPPQNSGAQGTDAPYHNGPLEMDIVSHDVRKFFGLLLKKNGYVLEQLFSPLIVHTTPEHEELKAICCSSGRESAHSHPAGSQSRLTSAATGVITKHHSHHYFGFAETQWKLFLKGDSAEEVGTLRCDVRSAHRAEPTDSGADTAPLQKPVRRVKPLLYVYRVLLTGIHLMRTGKIEANLITLNEEFQLSYIPDLVARKLAGPEDLAVGQLLDSEVAFHESEYQRLRGELQAAHDASPLPEAPSAETWAALDSLLVRVRLQQRASLAAEQTASHGQRGVL